VPPIRLTTATGAVLRILLEEPGESHYGLEICEKAGFRSGTVYPVLARLEKCGWLQSAWEQDPGADGGTAPGLTRPRRRYYRFSTNGAAEARDLLARAIRPRTAPRWNMHQGEA
jgi:PadR family transcriptional regulator PadR